MLYYFFATATGFPESGYWPLSMYRAEFDGVTGQTQLRADSHPIGEALWVPDASGAVILDISSEAVRNTYPFSGPLLYLKSDGSPTISLVDSGRMLRWGK